MSEHTIPDAWVTMPSESTIREVIPAGNPYDFGFMPAMTRLIMAHERIGPMFGALFSQIMFEPGHLSRAEKEMVAAVAAITQDCFY